MDVGYSLKEGENLISKFEFLNFIPGYAVVKDTNSKFPSFTTDYRKILGWRTDEEGINKCDHDIPSAASDAAELFISADQKAFAAQKNISTIEVCNYSCGLVILLAQRKLIRNEKKQVVGVFAYGIDVTEFTVKHYKHINETDAKFINKKGTDLPKQYFLSPRVSPLPISERQQDCLSLLIRGKTLKEIAFLLNISNRTVETHLEAIKHKLGCINKSQLIEKAIDSGFLFYFPKNLFGVGPV